MITPLKRGNGTIVLDKQQFRSRLKSILGFKPGNLSIYEMAFIHRSATLNMADGRTINNERLEFLGDAILDAVLSEYFFEKFPEAKEGELTRLRAKIVNREQLNILAAQIGLDTILVSHINKSSQTRHLYGDALEALIGSLFIDRGYSRTRRFIINNLLTKHIDLEKIIDTENDYKSQVFRWAQKLNRQVAFSYKDEFDNNSKKLGFTADLRIDYELFGEGKGSSKKEAEQEASLRAWKKILRMGFIE